MTTFTLTLNPSPAREGLVLWFPSPTGEGLGMRAVRNARSNIAGLIVQEFIEGQDLNHELIQGKRLSEAEVIALLEDILSVLQFVHF